MNGSWKSEGDIRPFKAARRLSFEALLALEASGPVAEYLRARVVEEGECWIWRLSTGPNGSPVARLDGKPGSTVRRWMLSQIYGPLRSDQRAVCGCANLRCVRPSHSWPGANAEPYELLARRGYYDGVKRAAASARGASSLTVSRQELDSLVAEREAGASVAELARKHGVVVETIYKRLRRAARPDVVPGASVFALAGSALVTRLGRVGSGG